MDKPSFEEIEHTADWAIRVRGADLESLLRNAAIGTLQLIGAMPQTGSTQKRRIELEAYDAENLLVLWLEELLYLVEMHGSTFTAFTLNIEQANDNVRLTAQVQEIPRTDLQKEIKAVTYHNLKIQASDEGLEATLVFDV